jgi:glycosyltransferase involved in cell wall biosynthesis
VKSLVSKKMTELMELRKKGHSVALKKAIKEFEALATEGPSRDFIERFKELVAKSETHIQSEKFVGTWRTVPRDTSEEILFESGKRIKQSPSSVLVGMPKVTIITVVFNNVETVAKCIESVLAQTYDNIEYIIVDGASNDGTLDVIKQYENDVDYVVSQKDGGIYNAMNKGLRLATGDYIAFINADDFYISTAVEWSVENLIKNGLDISYAGFYYADENGVAVVADESKPWSEAMLVEGVPGGHETLFLHKDCYNQLNGYDESYRLAADYHLFVRCFFAGFKAGPLQRNILVMMPGGTSFNEEVGIKENRRVLEYCFGPLENDFFEFLYGLKYYKNWHGYPVDDKAIEHYLSVAAERNALLHKAMFESIENRKRQLKGRILPAEKDKGDKLKICIALNYLTNASGGAERIAIESANRLHKEGHAVTVIQCFGIAGEPYYQLDSEIPVIDLAIFPYKDEYLMPADQIDISFERYGNRHFPKLDFQPTEEDFVNWQKSPHFWRSQVYAGFFHHHKFDVVISHMPSTYPYTLLPRNNDDKTLHIASLHNSPEFKFYSPLYPAESAMERYMRLVSLENADKIGLLFEDFRSQVPAQFQEKCFVLPNFLSQDIVSVADSIGDNVDAKEKVILSVGRLSDQKDHATLIKAYAKAREQLTGWSLKIYGEGPLKNKLEKLCVELGMKPFEILMGARRDIHNIYPTGAVFAFPSLFEGFGLTALEAMSFGLPVIAFDNCEGVKNLVENEQTGLLINSSERVSSMSSALVKLCGDSQLISKLGKSAFTSARKYSLNAYIKSFEVEVENWKTNTSLLPVVPSKSKLKYAILATYTEGGAGIAAVRLAKGLRQQGVDCSVISFSPRMHPSDYKMELSQEQQALYDKSLALDKNHTHEGSTFFSNQLYPSLEKSQVEFLRHFDVINLHWIQMFLSVEVIEYILSFGKKVIWTLHDMAPLTGGCHYSNGCLGYTNDCSECPQLDSKVNNYPKQVLSEKIKRWQSDNLTIVSPSQWLADCAKQSQVFRNTPVKVIRNGLDTDVFVPTGKAHARSFFNLPQDKKILLFTCQSHGERRKGFKELMEVAHKLSEQRDDLHVLMFGHESEETKKLPIPYTALGHINEEWKLAVGYSAADVTLLPSLEDNLPNVILESSACGTPVVAFDSGGISDAVVERITGETSPQLNVNKFIEKINSTLSDTNYTLSSRSFAVNYFQQNHAGVNYIKIIE